MKNKNCNYSMLIKIKIMKTFVAGIFVLMVFSVTMLQAQTTRRPVTPVKLTKEQASTVKKDAAALYKQENYMAALAEYSKLVNYDPNDLDFNYRLGMCYLNSNSEKSKAVEYFVKAADQKEAPKDVYFMMGRALLSAGLFDEAINAFEKYKEVNKGQVHPKLNFERHLEYCYNAKEYVKKPLEVTFKNPGKNVNSPNADYACAGIATDTLVYFTSNRKGNLGGIVDGLGEIIPDIYMFTRNDTVFSKAKNLGVGVNSELYEISTGITSNGDRLMIYKENGDAAGDIFSASMKGKTWEKAVLMDESLETKIPETGASISNDGKRIFFSANMKGTLGGKDLWMVEKEESGKWSAPKNLGPKVNTKFDEDFPTLWHNGKTLFFASQGHTSIGGYDIFMSYQGDPSQEWATPMNIGYPLNTFDDDLYFTLSGNARTGYVSAVKAGGLGDLDIWYFTLKEPLIKNAGILFKASVLSSQGLPAKDAMAMITKATTGETLAVMEAVGPASEIHALLTAGSYKITIRSPKMGRVEEEINITGEEGEKGIYKVLKLQPNPSSKP